MEVEEATRRESNNLLIEMKYSCKFCHKRFPCGRSLGGHMRSHLITNPSPQQKVNTTTIQFKNKKHQLIPPPSTDGEAWYELREKPNKTWRAVGSTKEDPGDQDPNLLPFQGTNSFCCKECGKGFHSSKALSGHMKSHRVLVDHDHDHDDSHNNQLDTQSDIVNNNSRPRRSNRRPISGNANSSNNGSSSSVSEIDQQEQEEVAMCLILLSRDVSPWGELSDNNSVFLETPLTRVRLREEKIDHDLEYTTSGYLTTVVKVKSGEEFEINLSSKRSKYECSTCNKSFHSHQALGGHRASHKKAKGCSSWVPPPVFQPQQISVEGSTKHECPICFKVFASGQALGGHKRSHVIAQSRFDSKAISIEKSTTTTTTTTSNHEVRDFLDLNEPAPVEEEASNGRNQLHQKPWWVESTTKHDHLVGMI